MLYPISAVSHIELPHHFAENGDLVVIEGLVHVPFAIVRVFVVRAPVGAIRGQHAHKACFQFLACPIGSIEVRCDDGDHAETYILDRPNVGLLVPPGIWAQQTYLALGSVLTVLCDRPYELHDYVRDYDDFKAYREANGNL
ncbi:MAG: TDP-4-oxo-6-deoxy-alpha-D-glucose-3,4-oxoisomerase [Nitrosomonadaceae bacterium]|nr:TDP-4-oxo-6-deoxy-alpha-D-glucose-3,4-oxoisomerase [Nitrosomonadaceae bacterium]